MPTRPANFCYNNHEGKIAGTSCTLSRGKGIWNLRHGHCRSSDSHLLYIFEVGEPDLWRHQCRETRRGGVSAVWRRHVRRPCESETLTLSTGWYDGMGCRKYCISWCCCQFDATKRLRKGFGTFGVVR